MDAKLNRLLRELDSYLNDPPIDTPPDLLVQLESAKDMLEAPRYSEESPGERSAREIAEDVAKELGEDVEEFSPEVDEDYSTPGQRAAVDASA